MSYKNIESIKPQLEHWYRNELKAHCFMTLCYYYVTYAFQSESTLYICLNDKELLARNRRDIWSLGDWNWTPTHNHWVRKRTLNHLVKLTKWLSWVVRTDLYDEFDCMFLSCHVRISEWIETLYFPEFQGTPWWKQARYLKFKSLERDPNPQALSS